MAKTKVKVKTGAVNQSTEPIKDKISITSSASLNEKRSIPLIDEEPPTRPKVMCAPKAWSQIWHAIDVADNMGTEITWFTPVLVEGDVLRIPEIFIPEQEVTMSTTECPNLSKIVFECYQAGYDICDLRGWFHLHPNGMSVNPSGTDEDQAEEYLQEWDTLLRGIFNKNGDMKLDYYDKASGYLHSNIDIQVDWGDMCDTAEIDALIKERVKRRTYQSKGYGLAGSYGHGSWGGNNYNSPKQQSFTESLIDEADDDIPSNNVAVRRFLANIHGQSALVDMEEVEMFGQQAMLLHHDGVEMGYDIASAIADGLLESDDVVKFIEDKTEVIIDSSTYKTMFPCLVPVDDELNMTEATANAAN